MKCKMTERHEEELKEKGFILEQDSMICPYCGYESEMEAEDFGNDEYVEDEVQCSGCEQYYCFVGEVEFTLWATTRPLPTERRK